jgi:predicted nucleic acid-binding protein
LKIVVDTNIVFSSILKPTNSMGQFLINPKNKLEFYTTLFLKDEIFSHLEKINEISGFSFREKNLLFMLLTKNIIFIRELDIPVDVYKNAKELVENIDVNNASFIALSLLLNAKLWTGDKKLINGLRAKGLDLTITTAELLHISEDLDNYNFITN